MMKSIIGIFESHKEALKAVEILKQKGFPVEKISLLGKADMIDDHLHVRSNEILKEAPVSIGAIVGPIVGVLTGAGIFAVPGLGFLFGAGAVIGGLAGLDLGIVGGGIITLLATLGIKKEHAVRYHEHLKVNRFLVIAHGDKEELDHAKKILEAYGHLVELQHHD
jgi:hypothetical protein